MVEWGRPNQARESLTVTLATSRAELNSEGFKRPQSGIVSQAHNLCAPWPVHLRRKLTAGGTAP